ncbi:2-oxo acid dehydrogenase subunit E2 [Salibacterium salarium]|uniref:Dihydrolipoamide acetyltransferase component of pyruvate dehydrogenase complex n=1 Tax=Salibacterium salarium TaxID=284579 RepID=A0A3R9RDN2_9BACI|nr:dihydrolipoamide acetyltransferase family protein [Salibacterium salarium]RSL33139.1 2-oxo acid dehydrogenase subunit E2 [Salibacterium salarium]
MIEVKLHDIGEGMHEAEILNYLVKPGDTVKNDEPLVEIQTDKMSAELPAPSAGTIKETKVEVGDVVEVGEIILIIDDGKEQEKVNDEVQEQSAATISPAPPDNSVNIPNPRANRVLAAPFTRKIARDHGVDMERVQGSGPAGRVLDEDVYAYVQEKESTPHPEKTVSNRLEETVEKAGETVNRSFQNTDTFFVMPHLTYFNEIDMTNVLEFQEDILEKHHIDVSVSSFLIKALQIALRRYPSLNAKLENDEITTYHEMCNVGLVTEVDGDVLVPVLEDIQHLSLSNIDQNLKSLTEKAKEKDIDQGSDITFGISNVDPQYPSAYPSLIGYSKGNMMTFHRIKDKPAVHQNDIKIRKIMGVTLTFDHRMTTGANASTFTDYFTELMENPNLLFMELM